MSNYQRVFYAYIEDDVFFNLCQRSRSRSFPVNVTTREVCTWLLGLVNPYFCIGKKTSGNQTWQAGKSPKWMEVLMENHLNSVFPIAMVGYRRVKGKSQKLDLIRTSYFSWEIPLQMVHGFQPCLMKQDVFLLLSSREIDHLRNLRNS